MGRMCDKLKQLPQEYTFGLELEFTGGLTSDEAQAVVDQLIKEGKIREGWTVHYDNSVVDENGKGAEIVSPVLRDDEQTKRELDIITAMIKASGGVMTEKDGGHIHFGVQCLGNNINDIKNFFKLYTVFEPLLYKISTGDLNYVRPGCGNYAKPIQKRLVKVIDGKIDSLSELMTLLAANIGANPTHYGENRYYGLNIQRMIEAIRNKSDDQSLEDFLQKMFAGEPIYDEKGKQLSPTIEMRFRNGSSNADEILSGVRMCGQMFVAAKEMKEEHNVLKSLYRKAKARATYAFGLVLNRNRTEDEYADCESDEEIIAKKFAKSPYGNGVVDKKEFKAFLQILYPEISDEDIDAFYEFLTKGIQQTPYKKGLKARLASIRDNIVEMFQPVPQEVIPARQLVRAA